MSASAVNLSALRQLLSERFPVANRPAHGVWPTGVPAVDEAAGGLPRQSLTELVCTAPSSGGQLFIAQLLAVTRRQLARVALIDATDNFDPQSIPDGDLQHLVWVRSRSLNEALASADLLARESSLDLVILDLTYGAWSALRRVPAATWYRLQRAVEQTNLVFLALTPLRIVVSAQLRLQLTESPALARQALSRPQLIHDFAVTLQLQRHTTRQA
ncbi:MAG: hypothetical protein ABI222_06480 [Opitutaceae bacterium]